MDMTKYLMMLLFRERIGLFACTLRVCFLLFESLRVHLKLQLEVSLGGSSLVISRCNPGKGYSSSSNSLFSPNHLLSSVDWCNPVPNFESLRVHLKLQLEVNLGDSCLVTI